ncbi:hypothetical protein NBRC3280_3441 [Acetobacter pasteurianus NBRC 3280]|uniref:NADP oxidoreductase coenzyme F420-dependent n=2 Tax=Acetobacter pasteurianus TaxID=438 RepID=A0A401X9A2_ACEPA|nr:hypothetical protein [Acetobacter pasteurianus]GCD60860.1 hypothetical protein NBRC3277_3435 [Acetobacter pasteurianus NBRC 3277]GCD64475.1 hypothetical protein NBRC3278_3568 [Acetobacter pasteurianus NBRC 3278]GCD70806.1 hypothetical protein NBRC3280_3441 [Acetobacter pasteurianus NBRC 3280]
MHDLENNGRPIGAPERYALPIAGDDEEGKAIATTLYNQFGFDTVDAGPLSEGWRFEHGTPAYCVPLTKIRLENILATTMHNAKLKA